MPTVNLTDQFIKALKPTGTRIDYFDDSLPGFGLRLSESGRKSWCVMYRFAGRFQRYTLGTYPVLSLKEARINAKDALHDVQNGENPAVTKIERRKAGSFEELAQQYLEDPKTKKKRSLRLDQWYIEKRITPYLGSVRAQEVTRRDVRAFLDKYADKTPVLANRLRALLSKIFNWAIGKDFPIEYNPVTKVPLPGGKDPERERVLSEEEIKGVWKAFDSEDEGNRGQCGERLRSAAVLKVELLTAQRGGEVAGMAWSELDLNTDWWTIPGERTKNKKSHRVPLSKPVLRILEEIAPLANSLYVFPSIKTGRPIRNLQKAIKRIQAKTGIDFHGHDLRRTAASMMTGAGIPRLVVSKILNHTEGGITQVYDRYSYDTEKREALEAWARKLMITVSDLREAMNANS